MGLTLYTLADAERIIARGLHRLRGFDTVVGVPRSGQVFAAFVATQTGAALADVGCAGRGISASAQGHVTLGQLGRVLLVEDIVNKGTAMEAALETMRATAPGVRREDVTTCCLWTNPNGGRRVDLCLGGDLPQRYAFTWQMWRSALWPRWGTDMDGVLCEEATSEAKRDAGALRRWAATAAPRWLPKPKSQRQRVGAIITGRPEGIRAETEAWLLENCVDAAELVMVPVETLPEVAPWLRREGGGTAATWKAREAGLRGFEAYIESHDGNARMISDRFDGLVWCTDSQTRYRGGTEAQQ